MIANFGYGALVLTFLVSIYGILAALYGVRNHAPAWVDSARNAMLLTFPLMTLSALAIILLLVSGDYQIEYVASVTSNSMPLYLKVTALWGGQSGSLVFLVLVDGGLRLGGDPAEMGPGPRVSPLGRHCLPGHLGVFPPSRHFL